ncbi:MAG: serine/threonine-protein kinase [Candidatus Obscuribacterales bacterium]
MKAPLETSLAYKYFVAYRLYDGQRFDEIVIPYKPEKALQRRLQVVLRHDTFFQGCLSLLAIFIALVTGSPVWFLFMPMLACLLAAAVPIYSAIQPTHLGFSEKGLRLYWIRWFGDKSTLYLPWNKIESLSVVRRRNFATTETQLRFQIDDQTLNPKIKRTFFKYWNGGRSKEFYLHLEGIASGEHRKRLHTVLKEYVPADRADWALHDTLNPIRVDNYTTLWLEVLSGGRKRIREDVLTAGASIGNDRYEIVDRIGSGGQGTAYLAKARAGSFAIDSPEMDVVLKEFCLPYYAGLSVVKKALDNIDREAELLRKLQHPQIVRLVDLFVDDQRAYLVLQHVPGNSLKELVQSSGKFSEERVVELGIQMCDMLEHLHMQSPPVVHRDFTPENLILSPTGELVLIDFNVAQQLHSTATRTVVGKHSYIPPEQFRGKACPQSDIYALGASLFYLITGEEPEPITTAHPKKLNDALSGDIDNVVAHATALDLDLRYSQVQDLRADLYELAARFLHKSTSNK